MVISSQILDSYFQFSTEQKEKFAALFPIYQDHNSKVNLISRKDFDNFYVHHVLHSLALLKINCNWYRKTVIDIGTGGGFPGIPLAIALPDTHFYLIDSIGKKINVVKDVASKLELQNITAINSRTEAVSQKFDIAIARAVAQTVELYKWMQNKWNNKPEFVLLKGGDLQDEKSFFLNEFIKRKIVIEEFQIRDFFNEDFFETKKILHIKDKS